MIDSVVCSFLAQSVHVWADSLGLPETRHDKICKKESLISMVNDPCHNWYFIGYCLSVDPLCCCGYGGEELQGHASCRQCSCLCQCHLLHGSGLWEWVYYNSYAFHCLWRHRHTRCEWYHWMGMRDRKFVKLSISTHIPFISSWGVCLSVFKLQIQASATVEFLRGKSLVDIATLKGTCTLNDC